MSELKTRITEDMKVAMKAGDKPRLGVIRLILAAVKQREVDERITLDDAQVLHVLEKMLKQRRDSVTQYAAAQREDLADQERFEIGVIEGYRPAQLSDAELDALVAQCTTDAGASSQRDMGKVMALLKERAAGRADMGAASQRVKARLAGHS
ncbi:MAG: GatB/YqeY domain-containing protein [Rhodanobacteraceae bacterium]